MPCGNNNKVTILGLGEGQEKISFNISPLVAYHIKFKVYLFEECLGKYIMLEFNVNETLHGRN